ncbi:hypothetical protein HBN50_07875 [Halobacteriovorax sp. GB3]|uniref:hypothetical protein n=1 Tax=Halobacteriovorax sp. GB3 TaxID=2719615 RepID=UPI00235EE610|nr:hypothetical protein [Halobacteriovorax sp. GB3]MDD0853010.1 hypothetical protein [Halobacteriovorax sp. GB3]
MSEFNRFQTLVYKKLEHVNILWISFFALIFVFTLPLIILPLYGPKLSLFDKFIIKPDLLGQYGSYVSGVLSPILSFFVLYFIILEQKESKKRENDLKDRLIKESEDRKRDQDLEIFQLILGSLVYARDRITINNNQGDNGLIDLDNGIKEGDERYHVGEVNLQNGDALSFEFYLEQLAYAMKYAVENFEDEDIIICFNLINPHYSIIHVSITKYLDHFNKSYSKWDVSNDADENQERIFSEEMKISSLIKNRLEYIQAAIYRKELAEKKIDLFK